MNAAVIGHRQGFLEESADIFHRIKTGFDLKLIKNSPSVMQNIFTLVVEVLSFSSVLSALPAKPILSAAVMGIDLVGVCNDAFNWRDALLKFKLWQIAERTFFLAATALGLTAWIAEMGFIPLVASALELLSVTLHVSLSTILSGLLATGFAIKGAKALKNAIITNNRQKRVYSIFLATRCFLEVLARGVFIGGVASGTAFIATPIAIAIGGVAFVAGLIAYFYKCGSEKELAQAKKDKKELAAAQLVAAH